MSFTDDEKPEDFIFKAVPKSTRQAASQAAETRVTSTVKSALQEYLARFFSADGCYRNQLKMTAPYSVQYETGISGSADNTDPTIYQLQLARLWGQLRQKLPCIIIVDKGYEYNISGLGGMVGSRKISDLTSTVSMKVDAQVTVLLEVAANDETTCSDLRDLLVYILGPLTIYNKSHIIYSGRPQDHWEMRLPQSFEPQGLDRKSFSEDSKDAFWSSGIELTVDFEGTIELAFDNQIQLVTISEFHEGMIPDGFRLEDGSLTFKLADDAVSIEGIVVPEVVNLGRPTPIQLTWLPAKAILVSDDPRVALVTEDHIIIPKRLGKFRVHLMDYKTGNPVATKTWEVSVKSM